MPEVSQHNLRESLCPRGPRFVQAALITGCLAAVSLLCARADTPTPAPPVLVPVPMAEPAMPPITHITDAQDRLGTGHLGHTAENRSEANALYAEAMLLPDGIADDQQKALGLFRQIVTLDPSFTEAQVKLANILLQTGRFDDALAQLRAVAADHPDSVPIEVALGYTQHLREENDEARRLCTKALAADPNQSLAMRVLLDIASDQDDLAGGVLHIEDILKAGGSDVPASAWLNLARLYLDVTNGEHAPPSSDVILKTRLPMLQEAAAKSPPEVDTLTLLAETYLKLDRKAESLKTYRQASDLDPSDVDLILHCADLEFDLGRSADGIKDYEQAYALDPSLEGLRERLGGLYLDSKRYDDAARLYEEALADAPQNPTLEIDLGIAYEEGHHPDKAQACFQQVFNSVDCPPEAYLKLVFYQWEHKEVKQAGQTLSAAQTHFPQSARICFYEAIQHQYEKNYDAALVCLAQVRTLAVGSEASVLDHYFYSVSAEIMEDAGQKDRLEAVLQEGLQKFPDDPELMNELAYYWAEQGTHLPEALTLSRHSAELEPDNGPILDTLGWVYYQMDQAKDALPYLQRAAILTNNDPVVLQHVGDTYLKLGLRREAIVTWTRALEKDPHNGDLAKRIDAALAQAKNVHLRSAPTP